VVDPESTDGPVHVRQREAVGSLRVGEAGRVEIQADAELFGPVDPALEVLRLERVAVDPGTGRELDVAGVQVEAVLAGNERKGSWVASTIGTRGPPEPASEPRAGLSYMPNIWPA
jgi:hypothetical protein